MAVEPTNERESMANPQPSEPTSRVRLADEVTLQRRESGGHSSGLLCDGGTGKYYHVGASETFVLERIADGGRDLPALVSLLYSAEVDWTNEDLARFIETLSKAGLIAVSLQHPEIDDASSMPHDAAASAADPSGSTSNPSSNPSSAGPENGPPNAAPAAAPAGGLMRLIKPMSWLISFRIPIANFDRPAASACWAVGGLFHPVVMAIVVVWIIAMSTMVAINYAEMISHVTQMFDRGLWLPMLAVWVVAKFWHELGHAVAAKRLGIRLGNIGIMFFIMAPLAYVDVTDAWRLRRRRDRIMIAMAGVYFELIVASFAAAIWWMAGEGFVAHFAAQVFLISGPATLLTNANPLLRLDGYYALSDLVDIPNLRAHGRGQLVGLVDRAISGAPVPKMLLVGWRRSFATAHAIASVLFQIVWMGGLVFAVAYMFSGLGVILAVVAFGLWVVLPTMRYAIVRLMRAEGWGDRLRLISAFATIAVFGQVILSSTSPLERRVPVIVDDAEPQIARAPASAFVRSVFVTTGQSVTAGQLLMRLRSDDLQVRRNETADELRIVVHQAAETRARGEMAESKAATEQAEFLRKRLQKLDSQIADLEIIAKRDGRIATPNLDQWVGRYASAGDILLTVSDPTAKEVIVSVDDSSMTAYEKALARNRPVPVRFRGGRSIRVTPVSLRPSSSKRLVDPAMSAAVGGPVAVQSNGQGEMESVDVRAEAHCPVSPIAAMQLYKGQIGSMRIGDDRTVGARLWDWANEGL